MGEGGGKSNILKQTPCFAGKFFTGKKHREGQQQSKEFDVGELSSSIPWLGKRKEFDPISGPEGRVV